MPSLSKYTALAAALVLASPAAAQRRTELGIDAGATIGLGGQSSVRIVLPGSRFRVGFFQPGTRLSIEPAAGFAYTKVEDVDGVLNYDLELGALYHLRPFIIATTEPGEVIARVTTPYVRPFVGLTGFTGGEGENDNEFSVGAGFGTKVPWRRDLAIRLEANVGYGFDNEAARIGVLAGLSFFPR